MTTVHGKGTFVAASDKQLALEARRRAVEEEFEKAMDDDFNTADAIAAIFDLVKYMNTTADGASSKEYLQNLLDRLCLLTDVLGIIVIKRRGNVRFGNRRDDRKNVRLQGKIVILLWQIRSETSSWQKGLFLKIRERE